MAVSKNQKIQIRMKAFYPDRLDYSVREIIDTVQRTGGVVRGPIPLPKRTHKWTVLSSPHVDKDARDQFQLSQHARLLIVSITGSDTMTAIRQIELPPEVDIKMQVMDD